MSREKRFSGSHEFQVVLRASEAVTFIGEDEILHFLPVFAHRFNNLVAFSFLYTRIIGSLSDQKRPDDFFGLEQWRARFKEVLVLHGMPEPRVDEGHEG